MKNTNLGVVFLVLLVSRFAYSATNQISGNIFRISYEPTGAFLSIQDNTSEIVTYNVESCGKDNVFHLPSDHLNYKVISAMLYSHHANNRALALTLSGCRYQTPVITAVEKIFN